MALSKEEKKALEEHYKGRDLYDPSQEPGQEPPMFSQGGMCEAPGYADGGEIDLGESLPFETSDFSGPSLSAATDTVKAPLLSPAAIPTLRADLPNLNQVQKGASMPPAAAQDAPGAALPPLPGYSSPQNAPMASQGGRNGLSADEFNQLIKVLKPSASQRIGQGAMSALAGLADAIETGVARTNGSNFQKNLADDRQKQKENLLNALKSKYEVGYKGQELGIDKARLAEEARAHDLEAGQRGAQLKFEQGKEAREAGQTGAKNQVDAAQKVIEAYEKGNSIGSMLGLSERPSAAEYNAAKNVIKSSGTVSGVGQTTVRIRDSQGKMHDLPMLSLPAARKRDPGLMVVK